jgi:8-oxo-dGTP diphosphatase / 2-hydroxy-dATP diphosphatase
VDAPLTHCGTLLFTTEGSPYSYYIDYYRAETHTGEPTEYICLTHYGIYFVHCQLHRTDEMRPAWFSTLSQQSKQPPPALSKADTTSLAKSLDLHTLSAPENALPPLPYDLMWSDDRYWFPLLIDGRRFTGRADFVKDPANSDGWLMHRYWFAATEIAS